MKLCLTFLTSALVAAVVACSGASGSELFAPAGSTDPNEPAPSTGDDSVEPDESSGGSSGSTSSSGSSSSSSSSSSGGTGTKDAGKDSSTTPPPPPPPTGSIYCGKTASCTTGTEVCCASFGGYDNSTPTFQCKPNGGLLTCAGASKIACDDRTDCPSGQICCGTFEEKTGTGAAECRQTCKTNIPGIRTGILCDPNATVDECISLGRTCQASQTLPGYYVCKD